LQIDHLVPLGEAWASGAFAWTAQQRIAYYNNLTVPYALQAVTSSVNESKGDDDPAKWMPPAAAAACEYVTDWMLVKYEWSLTVDSAEKSAIADVLNASGCGTATVTLPAVQIAAGAGAIRISGSDRYATAAQLSASYAPGVSVVYIASGTGFADALSAAPAAAAGGGPLLLTAPTTVPNVVVQALQRLQPQRIVVVGGPAAVSDQVLQALHAYAPTVTRVAGADRYATSRAIVSDAFSKTGVDRVYLASGLNFPDALSASAAAGAVHGAVLLVNGAASSVDAPTVALIDAIHPNDLVVAGGSAVISDALLSSAASLNLPGGSQRLSGADRYETSQAIDDNAFPSAQVVYLASGLNYPDALAGAAVAGSRDAPLFLAPGTCVTPSIAADIQSLNPAQIVLVGGPSALSDDVGNLVRCVPPAPPTPPAPPAPPAPSGPAPVQGVHPGAFCSPGGAIGYTDKGVRMICTTTATDSRNRWRAA
jgi:putative cell wall-binding protein